MGEDVEDIQAKTQTLMQAAMKIGEVMYAEQQNNAAEADAKKDAGDDDVVDADFEDVTDDTSKK